MNWLYGALAHHHTVLERNSRDFHQSFRHLRHQNNKTNNRRNFHRRNRSRRNKKINISSHNLDIHCSVDVLNLWHLHSIDDISSSISRQLDQG